MPVCWVLGLKGTVVLPPPTCAPQIRFKLSERHFLLVISSRQSRSPLNLPSSSDTGLAGPNSPSLVSV